MISRPPPLDLEERGTILPTTPVDVLEALQYHRPRARRRTTLRPPTLELEERGTTLPTTPFDVLKATQPRRKCSRSRAWQENELHDPLP